MTPWDAGLAAGTYTTGFAYEIGATSAVTMTYPSGRVVEHSYDLRFRPVGVSSDGGGPNDPVDVLGSWTFDIANRPETATLGNATAAGILSSIFDFDTLDRVVKIQHVKNGDPTSTTLFHERYADDAAGNRLFTERLHDAGNSEVYQYDNRDRLVAFQRGTLNQAVTPPAVDTPTNSSLLNRSQGWDLDANGNWTETVIERPGGTVTEARQVNAVNEYTKIGYVPTNHDANGNMLFDGQRAYTYDAQNRVTSIYNVCSQGITEFAYGPLGEQCVATQNGVVTYRIYVGTDVIAEYAANGDRLREYLDGPAGKLAMVDYTSAGSVSAGDPEVFFYLVGHLGSIVALTDAVGDVIERYSYEPYGQTIITDASGAPRSASAYGNPYSWTGQRYDPDNQLYHFYFRAYSPHLGRRLQRDPLGYAFGMSMYEMVGSNSIVFVDPYGLGFAQWLLTGDWDAPDEIYLAARDEFDRSVWDRTLGTADYLVEDTGNTIVDGVASAIVPMGGGGASAVRSLLEGFVPESVGGHTFDSENRSDARDTSEVIVVSASAAAVVIGAGQAAVAATRSELAAAGAMRRADKEAAKTARKISEQARDARSRFLPKNPGEQRPGKLAEDEVGKAISEKPGYRVAGEQANVRDPVTGQTRRYDHVVVDPKKRGIGVEVKSGTGGKTPSQRAFDEGVNSGKIEPEVLRPTINKDVPTIRRTVTIERPSCHGK